MPEFSEVRFNTQIRYGTAGGPEFNTDVTTVTSGSEQRNANWLDSRGQWQVADDVFNKAEIAELIAFFRNRMGRAGGFRFKDWSDWKCEQTTGYREGTFQAVEASASLQMVKRYVTGTASDYRILTKPVSGTVTVYDAAGIVATGGFTLDYATGRMTGGAANWTWIGEFDVPARFDTDKFSSTFEGYRDSDGESLYTVNGLTIVELT